MARREFIAFESVVSWSLALGFSCAVLASASSVSAATPVGDGVNVSAYNMPIHFGRPVIDTALPGDEDPPDLEWDPDNGSGLAATFGPNNVLPAGSPLADQLTVSMKITTWAGSPINVTTPDNGVISNTTFNKPGEIIQLDFRRTNGQSLSNPATNFDPFGFLVEDVQWREAGVAETRPIIVREDTSFFWFSKNGVLAPLPPALQSQVSYGPHPTGEVSQVIHSIDSLGDLSTPGVFYELGEDDLFDDGTAYFGVNPDGTEDFPIGLLETLFNVFPINEVHIGILTARAKYGDATLNDIVDGGDYTVWADSYLETGKAWVDGDFNNDSKVDGGDYTLWADNYDPAPALATAVPEPSTIVLAASGMALLVVARFRRRNRSGHLSI